MRANKHTLAIAALMVAGTIGPCRAQYGDVDGDGRVTVGDSQTIIAYARGRRYGGTRDLRIRRYGDIDPVTAVNAFGDSLITPADGVRALKRAAGLETDAPQPDYWPLDLPGPRISPVIPPVIDKYTYLDQFGNYTTASIPSTFVYGAQTVRMLIRTDGTEYDVYKDAKGDVYLVGGQMMLYPDDPAPSAITFATPVLLLRNREVAAGLASWAGDTVGNTASYGAHPVHYAVTILRRESTLVPAAGGLPFDGTIVLKCAVAFQATPSNRMESQQSWFFWLAPYVGVIKEGRASTQDATEPNLTAKPLLQAQTASIRGFGYPQF
ncbi:MAG TPA: hypothetical protein VGM51_16980 [Armatimonadota bacterium]|jgi:hypothetical protein